MGRLLLIAASSLMLGACKGLQQPPVAVVGKVDLQRFMGDWYVIASIPTFLERGAHNAVESYRLAEDGSIATTFTFREGGFDGPEKRYTPRGYVVEGTGNAVWGMQFIWPVKADYRIMYLSPDYSQTVVGRNKRDYVWIMARTPAIPEGDYRNIIEFLAGQGYDTASISKVPQSWGARP